jgi:hypothetical protein
MHTESRDEQPPNAFSPTTVIVGGSTTSGSRVQPRNAFSPIDVTLHGISTRVKHTQSRNAFSGIDVVPSGTLTIGWQPKGWLLPLAEHGEQTLSDVGVGATVSNNGRTHGGVYVLHGCVPSADHDPAGHETL